MARTRIAYVVTAPRQAVRLFLRGHLRFLGEQGFEVALLAPPGRDLEDAVRREGVQGFAVPIERDIAPLADLVALLRLVRAMRSFRPAIVNAGTPKGGFLGILAAALAGVPVRVYHLRALRLETTEGVKSRVLAWCERIASVLSTRVVSISGSLAIRYHELGFAGLDKLTVLQHGSSNGVDLMRFNRSSEQLTRGRRIREELGFHPTDVVIGFVGRLIPDKGIVHLMDAFQAISKEEPSARLLIIGDPEPHHPLPSGFATRARSHPRVTLLDYLDEPAAHYAAMDVFAFPSLREGFGNAALEASATGLPVVGFRATGVVDAVEDGVTGTLVPLGDTTALASALLLYLRSRQLRVQHGEAGAQRAARDFQPRAIWEAFDHEYRRLLDEAGLT